MYRRLRICSNKGGYEAIPEPPRPIDLSKAKGLLEKAGVPVLDARVMLIASLGTEVTISRGGRLLFKTADARTAEEAFERLQVVLGLPAVAARGRSGRPVG